MKVWCAEAVIDSIPMSSKQMKVWCAEASLMFGCRQSSYEEQANEGLVC